MKRTVFLVIAVMAIGLGLFYGYQWFNRPMVSVVMLTYKRADVLPKAIDSLLAQTYKDFELIILNDGSPDNTDEVMKKYTDKRIRYYKNPQNKGISYSRNRVTSLARGKYVAIMDDDDVALPERLEKQVAFLEKHPDIDVLAGQIVGFVRIPTTHNEVVIGLIQYNNFGNANVMYRRSFQTKYNITYNENLKYAEDWGFWVTMLFHGARFASIPDDVINRDDNSVKHYRAGEFSDAVAPIREYIGAHFSPDNPNAFYQANPCEKLQMIAKKNIFTGGFLQEMMAVNCSQ